MKKELYERILDLRNRISLDGDDTIFEEDYLLLDEVLDLIENILLDEVLENMRVELVKTKKKEKENAKI